MAYILLVMAILLTRFSAKPLLSLDNGQKNNGGQKTLALSQWHQFAMTSTFFKPMASFRLYLSLSVPLVILVVLLVILRNWGWAYVADLLSLLVLIMAFGTRDLCQSIENEGVEEYLVELGRGDSQGAYRAAMQFSPEAAEVSSWQSLHLTVLSSLSWRYFQCYFPVLFWFVVAGAPGALLYRLLYLHPRWLAGRAGNIDVASHQRDEKRVNAMRHILEWLPVRCFGLTLALVGNWSATFSQWLSSVAMLTEPSNKVVSGFVRGALYGQKGALDNETPELAANGLRELPLLMDRALVGWIAALGLVAIF